jgi:hypothetical protein
MTSEAPQRTGTRTKRLAAIRKGLAARDWASVHQALELARALDDGEITGLLTRGLRSGLQCRLMLARDTELHPRVRRAFRAIANFVTAARFGKLLKTRELRLPGEVSAADLPPLADWS